MSIMRRRPSQAYMVYEYNSRTFILLGRYLSLFLTCLYDTAGVRYLDVRLGRLGDVVRLGSLGSMYD